MGRRLVGVLAIAAVVATACSGNTQTASPSTAASASAPSASVAPSGSASASTSASASASASTGGVDLFNTGYKPEAGKAGGQVIIGEWQQIDTLNPYYAGAQTDIDVIAGLFNGFTNITNDFKYVPDLVDTIPTVDNGGVKVPGDNGDAMTTTWKLRSGLKWSDGQALTCDDVAYTWQWNMDKANTGLYGGTVGWEDIKAVTCPDPNTVVISWKNVYEGYLSLVAYILPKHYMSGIPVKDAPQKSYPLSDDISKVPFSGPFKAQSISKDLSEIVLVRNDQYSSPAWSGGHPAYLDKIIFKYYKDAAGEITGFKSGEINIAKDFNDADLPSLQDLVSAGKTISLTGLTYEFLRPNWASKVMGDQAMREALNLAVDKNAINQRILGGNGVVSWVNVAPQAYFYDKASADKAKHDQDIAKANSVLDAAGWTKGSDGDRAKNGVKADIKLCTTTKQARQDTLALVAAWLKQIGVNAKVEAVPASQIFASYNDATAQTSCNLAHGTYDVALHGFVVPLDPLSNYVTYYSKKVEPDGSNDAHINDPAIDQALDKLKNTVDPKEVVAAMATFQQEYVDKVVEVPLYNRKEVYLTDGKVGNFTGNPTTAGPLWNAMDLYLK